MSAVPHVVVPKTKYMQMVDTLEKLQKKDSENNDGGKTRDDITEVSNDDSRNEQSKLIHDKNENSEVIDDKNENSKLIDNNDKSDNEQTNKSPPGMSEMSVSEMSAAVRKHAKAITKRRKDFDNKKKGSMSAKRQWISLAK